ncbi:Retrovirus-related Pol poly from transposon [Brachionus plicatilis]|uniref:Retrovirus-related Pol poly from transposon n=1 Tax=Brachionus plicatilis TaxID=10195 RepID=A0A3M7PPA7_BRAPC|nr:Retrovirus-related Pol poly from transposon [Brachionus plicatilis]
MDCDRFRGAKALFRTLAWYCKEGITFDEAAFKRFRSNKTKEFGYLLKFNEDFDFDCVRLFVEEYFSNQDESKLSDHEMKFIENHQNHEIFMDCDVLDELKQNLYDVEEWFNQYDRIAYANEWSREEKGRKLPVWLKEKALNIWYDLEQMYKHNYEIVRKMIIDKMDRSNNIAYLQEFFNRTQKNGESVDDYSRTLKKAYNKAFKASMSEDAYKALLGRFRTGIIPEIQSIMCTTEPKSYDEAVEIANKIERSLELKIDTMNINRVENHQFIGKSESKDYSTKTWTGLRKRDISPFRNLKIEKQRYEGSSNNRSELAHKKCDSCQRYGHLAKYLLDNNEQTPRQTTAPYVKIKINGKNITAALDSGAAKTMISSSLARLINANPLQNNNRTKWITANGGKLVSKGEIFTRICFGNHSFIQKCELIDNLASDMLLGTDMLLDQEALIDYRNKRLCFGRTKLPLLIERKQKWKILLIDDK